jgi:trimeric autotransporter adhesin
MAKRISELPAAGAVANTDELELNQSGTSRKATRGQIVSGLAAAAHEHILADVADAGALAAKDMVGEADIASAVVTTAKLADLSVERQKLALDAVATDQLADDAVTAPKVADGAIGSAKIAANAVGSGQIANGAVINAKIADGAVTTAKIATNAIGSGQIANAAVIESKIADAAVTMAKIAADAVGQTQLANNAVTMAKIAAGAVTSSKIGTGAVTATQLASNAVTENKIAGNAVTAGKIAPDAVDTGQLADDAVTAPKIAAGAVTAAKIAANAVGPAQLASTGVTPGIYTVATVTVDQQGRITAASSGTAGEANTGSNIGSDGVGVFAGKVGVDLQFRHVAQGSNKVSVALNGEDIDIDVVEANLQIPAGNVTGLGALAIKNVVAEADIANAAVTTAKVADLSINGAKLALNAVSTNQLADNAVTAPKIAGNAVDSAKIAANAVGSTQLADNAVIASKIAGGAVIAGKIAAQAVGPTQLANTAVTPGVYTVATVTVDQQGRITAASSGTAGEANTGSNVGSDGVGVFAGKVGVDLRFRHIAPASNKITVALNGNDIDLNVVESNLQVPAGNVTGLAPVATAGTLAALTSLNANGGAFTNYRTAQDTVSGFHTFVSSDTGREKIFTGSSAATWTIQALNAGTHVVVHNIGTAPITFAGSGVTLKGSTTLAADKTAAVSWLPNNVVKLTGELS